MFKWIKIYTPVGLYLCNLSTVISTCAFSEIQKTFQKHSFGEGGSAYTHHRLSVKIICKLQGINGTVGIDTNFDK